MRSPAAPGHTSDPVLERWRTRSYSDAGKHQQRKSECCSEVGMDRRRPTELAGQPASDTSANCRVPYVPWDVNRIEVADAVQDPDAPGMVREADRPPRRPPSCQLPVVPRAGEHHVRAHPPTPVGTATN